ncbi:PepSY domain-containing membrane protein [Arcobacter venerupis]|uniref:PepSY domain-containing membrane protein n=1 Tax=Arcobacter venerupis TaxID=1054033 RepID=A0AAE7B7S7_9BACT|nr:PepSY-associated TM helix domain-containing protein [Arcobacter venerupis]QKF66171.1 PepSY domain-containing membrane protein [Arcobacter venerupis]RWS51042.1 hypothetical protein CKA56_01565 [Arcobacter venerupis]
MEKLNIKFLLRAHTIVGLFCIFLFYISSYFGSLTFFLPYISYWELPSKHIEKTVDYGFNIDNKLDEIINKYKLDDKNIEIIPPSFKDPRIKISTKDQSSIYLNPNTNEELDTFYEYTNVSEFFNELHFGENIPVIGQFLMGLASIGVLFLIFSAILLFLFNKKKIKEEKKSDKRFWIKWHKNLGLLVIPFLLIFALTGAFIGVMLFSSKPFVLSATDNKETNLRKVVAPIIFKQNELVKKSENIIEPLSLSLLQAFAKTNYENLVITNINIYNYKKDNSQTMFSGYLYDNRAITGNVNRVNIVLNSIDGTVFSKTNLEETHGIKKALSIFYFLHFMPDETFLIRVLFFILGLSLCVSLAFGYMIWAQKKLHNIGDFKWVNFLNRIILTIIFGSITCSSFLFFIHYLILNSFLEKDLIMKGMFYSLFFLLLLYSFWENKISRIIKINLYLSSFFFFFSIFIHGFQTNIFIWNSFIKNVDVVFYVDLVLISVSLILFVISKKIDLNFLSNFDYRRI